MPRRSRASRTKVVQQANPAVENRIHPFGQNELREQLENMEKQQMEELMRRGTRGKSIRMSSGSAADLAQALEPDAQKACCIIM